MAAAGQPPRPPTSGGPTEIRLALAAMPLARRKLLEGNKKDVVRFLDRLSARDPADKAEWRRKMAQTIDQRIVMP